MAHRTRPGTAHFRARHMAFLQNAHGDEKFLTELFLAAAHEGLRRQRLNCVVGNFGATECGFTAPDGEDHMPFDPMFFLDGLEGIFPFGALFTANLGDIVQALLREISRRAIKFRLLFLAARFFYAWPRRLSGTKVWRLEIRQTPVQLDPAHGSIKCLSGNAFSRSFLFQSNYPLRKAGVHCCAIGRLAALGHSWNSNAQAQTKHGHLDQSHLNTSCSPRKQATPPVW